MNPESSHEPYSAELAGAMDEALEGEPQAAELRRMRDTLRDRAARLNRDLEVEHDPQERTRIERELSRVDQQIAALSEEAEISQFVEDSVRVGLEMRRFQEG